MAKCRSLLQENQDLGKQISQGRVAQLEAELAIQKKYNQEIVETQEGKIWCAGEWHVGSLFTNVDSLGSSRGGRAGVHVFAYSGTSAVAPAI